MDKKKKIESNLEVLGIPVILYLALMSNVDIYENPTKPELYNRIFAEKGGIFGKFADNKSGGYGTGTQILRNAGNIKKYLEFLREIAFLMFEEGRSYINRKDCVLPKLEFHGEYVSVLEFPIKCIFEESNDHIEFIHKSIYEYFVSEYIVFSIDNALNSAGVKEIELAAVLGNSLKSNRLSPEILEFLKYKIRNSLNEKFDIINETFRLMLQDGMTYHMKERYKNVIDYEMTIFANMLEILHLWDNTDLVCDALICNYLKYNKMKGLNLRYLKMGTNFSTNSMVDLSKGVNLEGVYLVNTDLQRAELRRAYLKTSNMRNAKLAEANLGMADLSDADLSKADLEKADLRRANLIETRLIKANLRGADLREAYLTGAFLRGADLTHVNLDNTSLSATVICESQVDDLKKAGADLEKAKVYIDATGEIMLYEEYCKK